MRFPRLFCVSAGLALWWGSTVGAQPDCAPLGKVQFICNVISPEDFALVPGTDWMITSGNRAGEGAIRALNLRDRRITTLYPSEAVKARPDTTSYPTCPGPLDAADPAEKKTFAAHGIYLKQGSKSIHTLHVVHHGSRESVEVFELDASAKPPSLTWIGCAVAPQNGLFNAVVALPEGGFATTNTMRPAGAPGGGGAAPAKGAVWEWHRDTGWRMVPGSEGDRINGLEISKDGKTFYVAGWGEQTFIRVRRGETPVKRDVLQMPFRIDNLRLMADGTIYAAGHGGTALCSCPTETWHIGRINVDKWSVQEILREPHVVGFGAATVAVQVGKEIWIGTNRGDRIGYFPAP
jgi:hypothetical protein